MKQIIVKRLLIISGVALLTAPSVFAQKEKREMKENKDKADKNEQMQTIVITRNGNIHEKTTVEIDGNKVKVNGKDPKDNKDVQVNITTIKGVNIKGLNKRMTMYNRTPGAGAWNFDMNGDQMSFFSEDENRAMLGVVTDDNERGAEIESITKESAAEKTGLKKGDIITMIEGRKIENPNDITEVIRMHKPGDKISITYLRDGKEQKTTAELTKWKGIRMNTLAVPRFQMNGLARQWKEAMPPREPFTFHGEITTVIGRPRLGLSIQDTDDGIGVKVLEVDEESIAAKAGMKKDDIILGVDDTDIKGTDDVVRATRAKEKTVYHFKIKRGSSTQTIEIKIPRKLKTADL